MAIPNLNTVSVGYLKKFTPVTNWTELLNDIENGVDTVRLKYKNRGMITTEHIEEIYPDNTIKTIDDKGRENFLQCYDTLRNLYDGMESNMTKVANNGWWNKTRIYRK